MTKKHFIALADMIKKHNANPENKPFYSDHINAIADMCENENALFKRDRFKDYIYGKCGKNGGKVKQVA